MNEWTEIEHLLFSYCFFSSPSSFPSMCSCIINVMRYNCETTQLLVCLVWMNFCSVPFFLLFNFIVWFSICISFSIILFSLAFLPFLFVFIIFCVFILLLYPWVIHIHTASVLCFELLNISSTIKSKTITYVRRTIHTKYTKQGNGIGVLSTYVCLRFISWRVS